jgi:hypothetical protein
MMSKKKSVILWIISILLSVGIVFYTQITGPTYPAKGKVIINNNEISYKLPRSSDAAEGELITIAVPDTSVHGELSYMRYKSTDTLNTIKMVRVGENLTVVVPPLEAAGKMMYKIKLISQKEKVFLRDDFIIMRYRGEVPMLIVLLHVIIIFLAFLYSTRTGFEAVYKGVKTYRFAFVTLVTLFLSGLIFGPIMQKYAFDAYWTGWPFGHDLTDNKTLVAFIFWAIAFYRLSKGRKNFKWAIIAAVVLLIVFLIPHSVLGSEIDYTAK